MTNENTQNTYRYHVVTAKSDDDLLGEYNDLPHLVDQFWNYFDSFPNKYVVIDTKRNVRFTISTKD